MSDTSERPHGHDASSSFSFDYPPSLPLPPGVYSLLPLVDVVDNYELPIGPKWDLKSCKKRLEESKREKGGVKMVGKGTEGSALDSDDEDAAHDGGDPNEEFLVPFFLSLPPHPTNGNGSGEAPPTASRRSSTSSSRAYSMTPMTPIPTLRPSSPTPSSSFPSPHSQSHAKLSQTQPIGFLRPSIIKALYEDNVSMSKMHSKPVWEFYPRVELPEVVATPTSGRRSRRGSSFAGTPERRPSTPQEGAFKMSEVIKGLSKVEKGLVSKEEKLDRVYAVSFAQWIEEEGDKTENRREHMDRVVRGWKMKGMFKECLAGWRDEQYSIYGPAPPLPTTSLLSKKLRVLSSSGPNSKPASRSSKPVEQPEEDQETEDEFSPLPGSNLAFTMERAACALFGFATFGVHLTAYVEEVGKPLRIWVPRRSPTKQTWPSYLDNTVAGGISNQQTPFESILRECSEEASLSPSFVSSRLKAAGLVSYTYRTPEGWLQPEVEWCYDLKCDEPGESNEEGTQPRPNVEDGEVESFELMEVEEVVRLMCEGEFKPNCAIVLIDFFIRHGLLTHESDARFLELTTRMRRAPVLPGPA